MPALAACQAQRTGDRSRPQPPEGRTRVSASLDREHPRFILDPLKRRLLSRRLVRLVPQEISA
jgi:hypothetical protein